MNISQNVTIVITLERYQHQFNCRGHPLQLVHTNQNKRKLIKVSNSKLQSLNLKPQDDVIQIAFMQVVGTYLGSVWNCSAEEYTRFSLVPLCDVRNVNNAFLSPDILLARALVILPSLGLCLCHTALNLRCYFLNALAFFYKTFLAN